MNRINLLIFIIFFVFSNISDTAISAERNRVQIINNNVVADNGWPLRGEAMFLTYADGSTTGDFTLYNLYDLAFWRILRDDFHLNTVRFFVMRPPQNWGGGPGDQCFPDDPAGYRCFDLDYVLYDPNDHVRYPPPDTNIYTDLVLPNQILTALDVIDDVVEIAAQMGMYIILDYHPVLGHKEADAAQWWTTIAPRYQNRTHVIYELANEPIATPSFEYNIYSLIRNLAPYTHIILWTFHNLSLDMLGEVNSASQLINVNAYANGSVGYHPYWNYNRDKNKIISLRNAYPVINTEIGYDRMAITTGEIQNQISWIWLNGARIDSYGFSPNGILPSAVFWPADPYFNDVKPPMQSDSCVPCILLNLLKQKP